MAAAMQLYAGFALLVIAILAIIVLAALVSNLIGAVRRRFGWIRPRAHDDFPAPAPPGSRRNPPGPPSDNWPDSPSS
jgi:hypothetical protein